MRRDRLGGVPEPDKSRRAQRASHKKFNQGPDRDRENGNSPNQASHATACTPRMKANVGA